MTTSYFLDNLFIKLMIKEKSLIQQKNIIIFQKKKKMIFPSFFIIYLFFEFLETHYKFDFLFPYKNYFNYQYFSPFFNTFKTNIAYWRAKSVLFNKCFESSSISCFNSKPPHRLPLFSELVSGGPSYLSPQCPFSQK